MRLQSETGAVMWLGMNQSRCRTEGRDAHRAIIDAITHGDGERARRVTAAQISAAIESVVRLKADLESEEPQMQRIDAVGGW